MVDDTGQAKEGTESACVARQYSGTLGKIGNCQVAVSVHAVTVPVAMEKSPLVAS
jgi:SRSO17 transposase